MIVLVPAYEPDERLVDLVHALRSGDPAQPVVIVDDGSGPGYAPVFTAAREAGAEVVHHQRNLGKGAALKRGFSHIARHHPGCDVVSADCDGQHLPVDVRAVGRALRAHRAGIVLGARRFVGDVPARSRFGNAVTRAVFRARTGLDVTDTQTGLRGYPAWMLGWLRTVEGERFEYEMEVLLRAREEGFEIHEVPIETVYLDGNESSHFDPVRDSIRVYVPFLKFSGSSIAAFLVDATLFFALAGVGVGLLPAVVTARVVSATFNFVTNRSFVFRSRERRRDTAVRYGSLVVVLMGANYLLIDTLVNRLSTPLVVAKLLTEASLFVASYRLQRRFVFPPVPAPGAGASTDDAPTVALDPERRRPADTGIDPDRGTDVDTVPTAPAAA